MLKRDSLTAQMQQLSTVLAKVKRLIIEDAEGEAKNVTLDVFQDYYQLNDDDLLITTEDQFIERIRNKNLKAEELNLLAYFIDEYAGLQEELALQLSLYTKYLSLISLLEDEYNFMSLDHITRRSILKAQLDQL